MRYPTLGLVAHNLVSQDEFDKASDCLAAELTALEFGSFEGEPRFYLAPIQ